LVYPNERPEQASHHHGDRAATDGRSGNAVLLPSAGVPAERLARARTSFLVNDPVEPGIVRPPILASWTRSRHSGVAADHLDLPYETDPDRDSLLRRTANPIVDEIADQFATEPMSVILTDNEGVVLDRRTGDSALPSTSTGSGSRRGSATPSSTSAPTASGPRSRGAARRRCSATSTTSSTWRTWRAPARRCGIP
jgi:hypothetical protein